ncbi:MAG: ubiquinol-cytochrome c reductase iron-sulfur subunit [Candidatus Aminicenantales bacterium]
MKLKDSLFSRRQFLNGLIGSWMGALVASLVYPVVKFVFPPYREPDEVLLPLSDFEDMAPNSVRPFAWGTKLGLLRREDSGKFIAFVGVCTHLDCNVTYLPDQRKFFCACHEGWYDENGINIGGPPPRPLRRLTLEVEEENLKVRKEPPPEASGGRG